MTNSEIIPSPAIGESHYMGIAKPRAPFKEVAIDAVGMLYALAGHHVQSLPLGDAKPGTLFHLTCWSSQGEKLIVPAIVITPPPYKKHNFRIANAIDLAQFSDAPLFYAHDARRVANTLLRSHSKDVPVSAHYLQAGIQQTLYQMSAGLSF